MGHAKEPACAAVQLEGVHFRWPGQECDCLDIESFTLEPGERMFLSGPSGSGKSTLLGLIAGILVPKCGSVQVMGTRLNSLSSAARDSFRGDHIGFIFQQFNLVPYLSIVENVLIPCRFSAARCARAGGRHAEEAACALLTRLDLSPTLWDKPVFRLSIGQQQRVAAARALIGLPDLLIADEPTSALDTDRREAFLHLLLEECEKQNTSVLFVSHDTSLESSFSRRLRMSALNRANTEELA
ncbi:MAG: ABC transporter ATP-binding protein [Desulfovibrionaceae bacterium]|nr:ABC transporter ATP-binding protein [Desulfovibrionaceae bacterium]